MLFGLPCIPATVQATRAVIYQAESAQINPGRAEVVAQASFKDGRWAALKAGLVAAHPLDNVPPDLVFTVNEPTAGRFVLKTFTAVDAAGAEMMRRANSKHASLFADVQIGS